ncbi:uncharacterized protein LOC143857370 isoform X1 [Tasmannia lanceolata]|uniref:uncharacterized protein LOC143857370 isoform X1 n=1 Tax=Tasmannia lanceolata TaxID=3420 RepID=UPI0040633835
MALLGEDGRGYELARKLEAGGVWRTWLGESNYSTFAHFLSSSSSWESFMNTDNSKTRAQIQLQLRARALLYDKAIVSLFLRSNPPSSSSSSSSALSKLNPGYLQLHGDDIYFSLEDLQDGVQHQEGSVPPNSMHPKTQSRVAFNPCKLNEHSFDRASNAGSRYSDPESETVSQRHRHDELPETWYNQYIEKYRMGTTKQHKFPVGNIECHKRTPEGMSNYLRLLEKHKRRRQAFKEDEYMGFAHPIWENGSHMHTNVVSDMSNSIEDDNFFFPEMMFPYNCVPDCALPPTNRQEDNQKMEFYGVLDNLTPVTGWSAAMIEKFGIKPEYLRMEVGRSKCRGKNGSEGNEKPLSQDQASQMAQKVVARVLTSVGIEGATEASMDVLSQFLSCHISKLGCTLKVLSDSYRKQCSAIELLKMFLQTVGYGNLGVLAEHLKNGTKVFSHQTHHVRGLQSQHQSPLLQTQQVQRQMHMLHPQNLAMQQQQWDKLRRRQPSTPRTSSMISDKDRPMVEVKIENASEFPIDSTLGAVNKHQLQLRHQQMVMANHHTQSGHQFNQLTPLQIPQLQQQGMFSVRTPPVKVEGFQELMGGDASLKHETEEHRLTSPSK